MESGGLDLLPPKLSNPHAGETLSHLSCRSFGKGDGEDVPWIDLPVVDETTNTVSDSTSFSGASAGQNAYGTTRRKDGEMLFVIQLHGRSPFSPICLSVETDCDISSLQKLATDYKTWFSGVMSTVEAPEAPKNLEDITIYSAAGCPHCQRLKKLLGELDIPFHNVDVDEYEDTDAVAAFVESVNDGNRIIPTVLFSDGTTMTNPRATKVRDKLKELKDNA